MKKSAFSTLVVVVFGASMAMGCGAKEAEPKDKTPPGGEQNVDEDSDDDGEEPHAVDDDDSGSNNGEQTLAPEGWTCLAEYYGSDDGCDCGCGIVDPDCGAAPTCTEPGGCEQAACEYCYDAAGAETPCVPPPAGWECNPLYYDADICICGCGVPSAACAADSGACGEPGQCASSACEVCVGETGAVACYVPPEWTCDQDVYGDGFCDCGCGVADVDCGEEPVCTDPGQCAEAACDYCFDGNGEEMASCGAE